MIERLIEKKYKYCITAIIGLAILLRFYNYPARFGIAYDQAHDALVARQAVSEFLLPLVGPFSSGAQFQESGIWYWFLMIPSFLFNDFLIAPWVFTTVFCTLFVFAIILVGTSISNKSVGLIAGLFAAISTSQIGQSVNLSLTALMSFASLAVIYFSYKYIQSKDIKFAFFVGVFISLALTIHLQAVLLLVFIPIFFIVAGVRKINEYLLFGAGFFIPLIPLIVFDLKNDFVNISGLANYLIYAREVSYEVLGRRWLTFIFQFWPSSWATIMGGYAFVAVVTVLGIITIFIKNFRAKKLEPIWIILFLTFGIDAIVMRYVKSPLFDSYLNFLHPFIFLLAAYAVFHLIKWKKIIGIGLLLIIVLGSLYRDFGEITYSGNNSTLSVVKNMQIIIDKENKDSKIDFYDFDYKQVDKSLPLVLVYDVNNRVDRAGVKIGIISDVEATKSAYNKLGSTSGYTIVKLSSSSARLQKLKWAPVNPDTIYNSTENWHKN